MLVKSAAILIALLSVVPAFAAEGPQTEDEKTLYAIGLTVARSLSVFNLSPAELEYVKQGLTDSVVGKKPVVDLMAYAGKLQDLARARRKVLADKAAAAGKVFLDKAAAEKGAEKTDSGMVYRSVRDGNGAVPALTDTVKVKYRGTLVDGREFDSSYKRNAPAEFRLDRVIKCWTEGVRKMKEGGKARLVCPATLAYGDTGAGELILPGSTLNFEVELLEIKKTK